MHGNTSSGFIRGIGRYIAPVDSNNCKRGPVDAGEAFRSLAGAIATIASPADGVRIMRSMTQLVGAEQYLLLDLPPEHATENTRILMSNWPHDTLEVIGLETISRLADLAGVANLGASPSQFTRLDEAALRLMLDRRQTVLLAEFGHHELVAARIHAGRSRGLAVFSASVLQAIDLELLPQVQLLCCHVWSKLNGSMQRGLAEDPLSDRERECLRWVSEGKTTDEVAVILDVSANTVNRYILHATQKLSAANRTMAIAVAIRSGII